MRGRMVSQAGGIAAFLEDGILVSQPSPLGEGLYGSGFAAFFIRRCPKCFFISHSCNMILLYIISHSTYAYLA